MWQYVLNVAGSSSNEQVFKQVVKTVKGAGADVSKLRKAIGLAVGYILDALHLLE